MRIGFTVGQTRRAGLTTLRRRLFSCAAAFSHTAGIPTLKLAVTTDKHRHWWRVLLRQSSGGDHGDAVAARAARAGKNHVIAGSTA